MILFNNERIENSEVYKTILELLPHDVDLDSINPKSDIVEEIGLDSLDIVELVMAIENEFHIEIEEYEMDELRTIIEIVEYVEVKILYKESL